jgi:hypothetical protein
LAGIRTSDPVVANPKPDARSALCESAAEADLGVAFDVEEVRVAQVGVAARLAGPDAGGVDLALDAAIPVELEAPVDVLEQARAPR